MSLTTVAVLVVLFLVAAYAVTLYNALVRLKHGVSKAWSNIEVLLKQRHEELPKLVETCKQYMQHERTTLEQVIAARNAVASASQKGDMQALGQAETGLRAGLGQLFALAENYPQLKADQQFLKLQQELITTENRIQAARRFYNGNVRDYRNKCETFPSNLVAQMFGFQPQEFFGVPPSVKEVPDVEFDRQALPGQKNGL